MFNMTDVIPTLDRQNSEEVHDADDYIEEADSPDIDEEDITILDDGSSDSSSRQSFLSTHALGLALKREPQRPGVPYDIHRLNREFWPNQKRKFENMTDAAVREYCRHMELPMARVKKIMKIDDDVKMQMISQDAPLFLSAAAEMFIQEMTLQAWKLVEDGRRKTLQKCDVAAAACNNEHFDFLLDIVPREEVRKYGLNVSCHMEAEDGSSSYHVPTTSASSSSDGGSESSPPVSSNDIMPAGSSLQYILDDCDRDGKDNVYHFDNGLEARQIGRPVPFPADQLPPGSGVRILQLEQQQAPL